MLRTPCGILILLLLATAAQAQSPNKLVVRKATEAVEPIVGTWNEIGCKPATDSALRPFNATAERVTFEANHRYRSVWNSGEEEITSLGRWKHDGNGQMLHLKGIVVNGRPLRDKHFRVYKLTGN